MRDEYDFAEGQRGKFYRPDLRLVPPVHLEPDLLSYLTERAKDNGTSLNALVNELLKKDFELSPGPERKLSPTRKEARGQAMKEPGLDHRHRDKNGEIARKHGNTHVGTLRKHYGGSFAKGFKDSDTLAHVLDALDKPSLTKLVKDHGAGRLPGHIAKHS